MSFFDPLEKTVRVNGEERSGTKISAPILSEGQGELRFTPDVQLPSFRSFFRWLLKGDYKDAGARIWRQENPEQARINLTRIMESRNNRHLDMDWVDALLEAAGERLSTGTTGAKEAFVRFICERYGYEVPAKKPDDIREQEQLAALLDRVSRLADATESVSHECNELGNAIRQKLEARRIGQ